MTVHTITGTRNYTERALLALALRFEIRGAGGLRRFYVDGVEVSEAEYSVAFRLATDPRLTPYIRLETTSRATGQIIDVVEVTAESLRRFDENADWLAGYFGDHIVRVRHSDCAWHLEERKTINLLTGERY